MNTLSPAIVACNICLPAQVLLRRRVCSYLHVESSPIPGVVPEALFTDWASGAYGIRVALQILHDT